MQEPGLPANEEDRIKTLVSLKILDTAVEERFDRYTRLAQRLFDTPIAAIGLTDVSRHWFKSTRGVTGTSEIPRHMSFCAHAILDDGILEVSDARQDERFHDNPLVTAGYGYRFYAGAPLVAAGCNVGTLCIVDTKPRQLDQDDRLALQDIASMVSDELVAYIDDLTGLSNRRGFWSAGEWAMSECVKHERAATVIMLDIDDFKKINDDFSHEEGDRALAQFARLLRGAFRQSDTVARLGGDEFSVLLMDGTPSLAQQCLLRLRGELAAINAEHKLPYRLSCSSGVIEFDVTRHGSIRELVHEADLRMYAVKSRKRSGRFGLS